MEIFVCCFSRTWNLCHGEKNETVYICNGIWTIALVKHLTNCLIKINFFFFLILHIALEWFICVWIIFLLKLGKNIQRFLEEIKIILVDLLDFIFIKHLDTTLKWLLVISGEKVIDSYESNCISLTFFYFIKLW